MKAMNQIPVFLVPEPMFLALYHRLLFQIFQDPVPPFFTYSGSLPNFPSLYVLENILYTPGKSPVDPDSLPYKEGAVQWHTVLMEPLNKAAGALRICRRHGAKITLNYQLQM